MEELLKKIIILFTTAGGFGYINYFILHKEGVLNRENNKEDRVFFLLVFSIINLLIFDALEKAINYILCTDKLGRGLYLCIVLAVTILVTVLMIIPIFRVGTKKMYKQINNRRRENGLSEINSKPVRDCLFDNFYHQEAYIINLIENKIITSGLVVDVEESNNNLELNLKPFSEAWYRDVPKNYYELISYCRNDKVVSKEYINVHEKIRIIIIYHEVKKK